MSEYLKQKMLRKLHEARDSFEVDCENMIGEVVKEGVDHMKSGIHEVETKSIMPEAPQRPEVTPNYVGTELAEIAVDVYKGLKKVDDEDNTTATYIARKQPSTAAGRYNARALARSLVGLRNSGNEGKLSPPAGPNGGNSTNNTDNYYALTTSMSLEQYEEHIKNQWGLNEEEEDTQEEIITEDSSSAVKELEGELVKLEDTSWQSIDRVMRRIAKDHDITPKQLHKDFKSEHDGQIPDEWIKEQVEIEECGWLPLNEVLLNKNGMIYEVSMMYRGYTKRMKFFWPESSMPSRNEMQDAAEKFYPGSRLLAYYPVTDRDAVNDPLVIVPPMTENYVVCQRHDWMLLNDNDAETLETIYEEVGEPLSSPEIMDDGSLMVIVEDHDTGEYKEVVFGEGAPWTQEEYMSEDDMKGMSVSSGHKRSTDSGAGLTSKGVAAYRRKNPGSKLKTAVTTPPSKLKPGSKAANRRKSFCARSRSWNGERGKAARRRWNC